MKDNKFEKVICGASLTALLCLGYNSFKTDRVNELTDYQYMEPTPNKCDAMVKYPIAGLTSGETINGPYVFKTL